MGDPKAPAILLIMGSATQMIAWWALSINPGIDVMGQLQLPCLRLFKFSEAGLYDFIHEPQGVRFGSFRLDLEQRPPRGLCARKKLKLALLSLLESEQAIGGGLPLKTKRRRAS